MNNHNEIIISDNVTILLSLFTHFNFDSVLYHTYTDIASYHIPTVSLPIPGADPEILKKLELYIGYHGGPKKKILGFRWSKKTKITLQIISFWRNISFSIFKFYPFLYK